jgi:hypothetical protein
MTHEYMEETIGILKTGCWNSIKQAGNTGHKLWAIGEIRRFCLSFNLYSGKESINSDTGDQLSVSKVVFNKSDCVV